MLSIDLTMPMILVASVFRPVIVQVTREPAPSGSMSNVVSLRDLNGFSKSRSMRTVDGSTASVMAIRPRPAFRLPDQE